MLRWYYSPFGTAIHFSPTQSNLPVEGTLHSPHTLTHARASKTTRRYVQFFFHPLNRFVCGHIPSPGISYAKFIQISCHFDYNLCVLSFDYLCTNLIATHTHARTPHSPCDKCGFVRETTGVFWSCVGIHMIWRLLWISVGECVFLCDEMNINEL